MKTWNDKRYYSLDYYLKNTFGEKVYRISLNGGMTCPNRDGTLGTRGCIFCSRGGSGDFAGSAAVSVREQIASGRQLLSGKTNCRKFIAYFQAYTNTYASVSYLSRIFREAIKEPEIVVLSIATRPDCITDEILDLLTELNRIKPVWIELGLQTIHHQTAEFIRRKFSLSCYEECVQKLRTRNLAVITHVILGLPEETKDQTLETVNYLAKSPIQGIKLQLLHILRDTDLADVYQTSPFPILSLEEYCDLIVDCIERLPEHIVIHRITGDGPRNLLLKPSWSLDKKRVLNTIQKQFRTRNSWQGRLFIK
ncbi:(dimethylallyl)adenosine tRNA methylthiotransferase [uncultured Roseburia sp.]|uniref:TIGR01212 family radical SAM protein n=1 Tax=Brotonthovivens ammoniilytica TaxID=2981725 RepID=A0ABT2TN92_9FIRM|nr:TIGR01212 family radical SAM protein [Brotonthovivens ammoniilytica]MCU6763671.1 TIGR01212 family radical SAM protein [Brotonthovivens ammoniilytica]SCJ30113.1 (dimethylallyl)adenosine tRNA methylthiotransferase [uncultured Roseburia sp.]